jgi:hypothetical protein
LRLARECNPEMKQTFWNFFISAAKDRKEHIEEHEISFIFFANFAFFRG